MEKHQYTNQLIHETSPYLLQHAHNPVNWMPWGDDALEKAKKENKLLLISIGYAACHWCHVMEHESFEDRAIAQVMNEYFVCIKVDREERPDIDQIYMTAVQLMTQRGGWPLNIIALPDGRPFWGGTYFMKDVWMNTLLQVHNFYQENPDKTVDYAERLKQGISDSNLIPVSKKGEDITVEHLKQAVQHWQSNLDYQEGGNAGAPKFMMPNNLSFLLRWAHQTNDVDILEYVETTLSKMAMGGIYDQAGGGFARYSTDANWKVPHFEKMLYDNGQILSVYAQAFKKTKNPLYAEVINQTIDFLKREMRSPEHGFYSSLDADSEGEEGKSYVWKKQELEQLLKDEFELFSKYYNINANGYWEDGNYILLRHQTDKAFADEHELSLSDLKDQVKSWQATLLKKRESRIRPGLDDKILSSWNALAISGLVDSYQALGNTEFLELAEKNMQFIKEKQMGSDGSLKHSYKNEISKIDGFLEDYALIIQALLDLFETTGNIPHLEDAKLLTHKTFEQFFDSEKSIFYFTPKSQTNVINRSIEVHDNVIPASNSVMANNLFRLGHLTANQDYLKIAERMVSKLVDDFKNYPGGYSNWLQAALDFTDKHFEVVIAGEDVIEKLKKLQENYLPNCLFCAGAADKQLPLLKNRIVNGQTFIYICQNNTCRLPVESTKDALQIVATDE